jgi:NodT family efflux transporter outer membrane factor (OMF) lipoprotein
METQGEAYASDLFVSGSWPELRWWKQFHDPRLEELILQGIALNPSIGIADAQTRLAAAQAKIVGSALQPKLDLGGDITRYQVSKTGVFGGTPPGVFPFTYTQSEIFLNFQLEIDWWGKHRAALRSALGEVRARDVEAFAARISLGIEIAQAYYRYQVLQTRLQLAEKLVANRTENLHLIGLRVKKNLSSDIDYNTANIDLANSVALMQSLKQDSFIAKHVLQVLVAGQFDEEIPAVDLEPLAKNVFVLPNDLPIDLISHRPDITAQIWRTESASKDVYVAKAQFYPNLNLLALGGFQTIFFRELFKNKSKYGDAGPAIHLPIFEGGALKGNLRSKEEEYTIAVLQYENLLIDAVREVLDGITNVQQWNERYFALEQASQASARTLQLNEKRLISHLNSKIEVLESEKRWITDYDNTVQSLGAGVLSRISLIRALGGGFDERN